MSEQTLNERDDVDDYTVRKWLSSLEPGKLFAFWQLWLDVLQFCGQNYFIPCCRLQSVHEIQLIIHKVRWVGEIYF
jgi:hypothetical protein